MKVAVHIPYQRKPEPLTLATFAELMRTIDEPPRLFLPEDGRIDQARNDAFFDSQTYGMDFLFMLDSDNAHISPESPLPKMVALGKDIVTGVYVQKKYPYRPNVFQFSQNGKLRNFADIESFPFQVEATGGGFLLISKKVLQAFTPEVVKELGKPFSMWHYGQVDELGEDASFCMRCKILGLKYGPIPRSR
jgi:hypothetical protein